jgi:hypothetical protein
MFFSNARAKGGFYVRNTPVFGGTFRKQCLVNIGRAESPSPTNPNVAILFVPLKDGPRSNPKLLTHLDRDRNLSLRRYFGLRYRHAITLPR